MVKVTIKFLSGEKFDIEVAESDTIERVKALIFAVRPEADPARQKIILKGKTLKDGDAVSAIGLQADSFLVCMVSKPKAEVPPPAPAPAAVAVPASTPAPSAEATPPAPPAAPAAAPAAPPTAAPTRDFATTESIAHLTSMGFPESEVRLALNAAEGSIPVATEFLLSGIPPGLAQGGAGAATPAAAPAAAGGAVTIETLRQHPQFNQLRRVVQQNPSSINQVLDLIGTQSPELLQAIMSNHDGFMDMMNEPIPPGADDGAAAAAGALPGTRAGLPTGAPDSPTGGTGGQVQQFMQALQMVQQLPAAQRDAALQQMGLSNEQAQQLMQMPPAQLEAIMQMMAGGGGGGPGANPGGGGGGGGGEQQVIRLTAEEMEAVNNLVSITGCTQHQAATAYLVSDKDLDRAMNYILDQPADGGDEAA